jgi:hypothetical protein
VRAVREGGRRAAGMELGTGSTLMAIVGGRAGNFGIACGKMMAAKVMLIDDFYCTALVRGGCMMPRYFGTVLYLHTKLY